MPEPRLRRCPYTQVAPCDAKFVFWLSLVRVIGDQAKLHFRGNTRSTTMKWITRERVKVDRVACPWLIRKFVDPQAQFLFVPAEKVAEIAAARRARPPMTARATNWGITARSAASTPS